MPITFGPGPIFDPTEAIVPVIGLSEKGGIQTFLGSGFFVGTEGVILTCSHVLDGWEGRYGIFRGGVAPGLKTADVLVRDKASDVAVLRVDGYVPPKPLELGNENEITSNRPVCCLEYGSTVVIQRHFEFASATRLGNVTRVRDMTGLVKGGTDKMLEVSFPALRGASGAPVCPVDSPHIVWGMITGNTAHELYPAHVEIIYDEQDKLTEETRFYLPQGLAVNVRWLREAVNCCKAPG